MCFLVLFGRFMFHGYLAPGSKVNDLYSFALGIYTMTGIAFALYWTRESYIKLQSGEFKPFIMDKATKVKNNSVYCILC
jgi:hypothetical protein